MADPGAPLTPTRLLWVEGKDDLAVVHSLCAAHQVSESFTVQVQGGLERLVRGVALALRAARLERFGIVVDANGDGPSRWQELRRIAQGEGYHGVPDTPEPAGTILPESPLLPRFGIWIMPDNGSPGALEDFAAALVPEQDALWTRARETVDALPEQRFPAARRAKAHMHTWLAWQESPGSPMGQAIGKGDLLAHAPAAQGFVAWLRRLMVNDTERLG